MLTPIKSHNPYHFSHFPPAFDMRIHAWNVRIVTLDLKIPNGCNAAFTFATRLIGCSFYHS